MEIVNEDFYNKCVEANTDPYGSAIIRYATNWADIMESKMGNGEKLEHIAEKTSHDADTEGVTGYMYAAAVSILANCWLYGEQLRKWHNIDTQLGTEGEEANKGNGVLNPALLSIGKKDTK